MRRQLWLWGMVLGASLWWSPPVWAVQQCSLQLSWPHTGAGAYTYTFSSADYAACDPGGSGGIYTSAGQGTSPQPIANGSIETDLTEYPVDKIIFRPSPVSFTGTTSATLYTWDGNTIAVSLALTSSPPVAGLVNLNVAQGSSNNPVTLNLSGGAATSVAVASQASHGTATAAGTTITYTPTASYAGADSFTYTATNAGGTSSAATVSVTVSAPTISIAPASLTVATVGAAYSQSLTASGGTAGYSYALTAGALPAGLGLASNGSLSGTPTAGGTFNFTIRVTDSSTGAGPFTANRTYSLTVNAPTIAISPAGLGSATVGMAYSQSLTASGGTAPYSYAVTAGALPTGLTLTSSGYLSGTPTASGNFNFTVTALDSSTGAGPYTASRAYTLAVAAAAPTVNALSPTSGPTGGGTSVTLTGTGFSGATAVRFGATSAAFVVNNATSITATSPSGSAGTVDVTVTTAGGTSATSGADQFTYVAMPSLSINSVTVPEGDSGTTMATFTVSLSAASASTVTVNYATANGTATAGQDYIATSGSLTFAPGVTVQTVGVVVNGDTLVEGHESFVLNLSSPSGATITNAQGVGSITNDDTATVTMADASLVEGHTGTTAMTFTVTLDRAVQGGFSVNYATADGTATVADNDYVAATGTLTFAGTAGETHSFTVTILGDSKVEGNETFTVRMPMASGNMAPGSLNITDTATGTIVNDDVAPTLSLVPASLPGAALGAFYSQTLTASGGTAPYGYAITSGSVPSGLSLSSTGVLSGTATAQATFSFTVTATDAQGFTTSRAYTVVVGPAVPVAAPSTATVAANSTANAITLSLSGGPATSVAITAAPAHGTVVVTGASIYYSPVAGYGGSDSFSYTASNASGTSSPATVTLTVTSAVPAAPPVVVSTGPNQSVTIHATAQATGGPFTALVVHTPPSSGTVEVQGMNLVYTPATATVGAINFAYTLGNSGGMSAPIPVTVQVAARPDPTADASVRGVVTAQQQTAVRFAGAQLMNFSQRLEQLRNPHRQAFTNQLQLAMPRAVNLSLRNCQTVPSLLGQQDCIERQGMLQRDSLAPGWSRAAQQEALAAADGLGTQAYASSQEAPGSMGTAQAWTSQPALAQRTAALGAGSEGRRARGEAAPAEPGSAERPRLAYWTAGMVDWGVADASPGQDDGLRFTTSGVTLGVDYLVNAQWTVGVGMGLAYDRTRVGSDGSRNHSRGVSSALYGSWAPAPAYFVDAVLGYSRMRFDTRRWVSDAGDYALGERDGDQWFAALSAGYEWRTAQVLLSPYARVQVARSQLQAYTETGAGWHALRFGTQRMTSRAAALGLRGETSQETRWGMLLPFGRLELQHDFETQSQTRIAYADLAGQDLGYAISSTPSGRNRVQLGVGSRLQSRLGTFAAELQWSRSSTSFQRGLRVMYNTRY